MKKLMLLVIALAAFFQTASLAQNLVGTWQGTLRRSPRDLHSAPSSRSRAPETKA